ncbi:MAG: radical SAM protein [Patescibacteria group bacterium]
MAVKVDQKHDFTAKLRQPSVLSRLKEYVEWQKTVRKGIKKVETPNLTPISINLDLTTTCNFRCDHCIDINVINSKIKHDHGNLLSSLKNMIERGLRSVILIGGGEPTLYPRFVEIIQFLKENSVQIAVSSNGSRGAILCDAAEFLKAKDKDWMRLSMDAGANDTWQKIHKPKPKIALEEICAWVPKIRNQNSQIPIGFSFIITWKNAENENGSKIVTNINEIGTATKLAREYGFNYISFKPFLTRFGPDSVEAIDLSGTKKSTIAHIREEIDKAKQHETENFKVIESANLKVLENGSWRDFTRQPKTCHMAVFRQVLSPIGLFHCPGFRGIKKSYISDKNAYCDENISQTQKAVANILVEFDASKECVDCTCLFNQTNWWIEKLVTGETDIANVQAAEEQHDYYF